MVTKNKKSKGDFDNHVWIHRIYGVLIVIVLIWLTVVTFGVTLDFRFNVEFDRDKYLKEANEIVSQVSSMPVEESRSQPLVKSPNQVGRYQGLLSYHNGVGVYKSCNTMSGYTLTGSNSVMNAVARVYETLTVGFNEQRKPNLYLEVIGLISGNKLEVYEIISPINIKHRCM